jgi:nicotinate-nucleotide pyrophosphorylase (carboxylating)
VLLDNMDDAMLLRAAEAVRTAASAAGHRAPLTEASGNMTLERLARVAAAGIDRVSASRITLTAPIDFGLDELETGDR